MLLLSDLVPDQWYIASECAVCETKLFLPDLSEGKCDLIGSFIMSCTSCGIDGVYKAQRYYHDQSL